MNWCDPQIARQLWKGNVWISLKLVLSRTNTFECDAFRWGFAEARNFKCLFMDSNENYWTVDGTMRRTGMKYSRKRKWQESFPSERPGQAIKARICLIESHIAEHKQAINQNKHPSLSISFNVQMQRQMACRTRAIIWSYRLWQWFKFKFMALVDAVIVAVTIHGSWFGCFVYGFHFRCFFLLLFFSVVLRHQYHHHSETRRRPSTGLASNQGKFHFSRRKWPMLDDDCWLSERMLCIFDAY